MLGGFVLLVAYLVTLAPNVTLWDAGEFLAAIRTLGIPHPPGTPLFVIVAHSWSTVLSFVPFTIAVNAASAVATAFACTIFGCLVARWTRSSLAGFSSALLSGTMASVWQSATETEVYAYSLLLVALTLIVADRAGIDWSDRHRLLIAYLFGVAVPLHISALIAAPGILYLCATDAGGEWSLRSSLLPLGAFLIAAGLGTISLPLLILGAAVVITGSFVSSEPRREALVRGMATSGLVILGASAVLFMLVRAQFDPGVNQGNPVSWTALVEVVGRRQYDVPPMWPRRAPFWLQVGNMFQYADWQVASAMSDWPGGSWRRTPFTLVFIALAAVGSIWHRRRDRRSWNAFALLLVSASLGVVVVLNLHAGPSYGFGVLPAGALREARERDYFFSLAFAIWGVWCGCGIAALATRRWRAVASLTVLPLLLNWRVVDRRHPPESLLADMIGRALLQSAPVRSVLVLSGDNDSYPVWYAQRVRGERNDVTPVTVPLLAAEWYRAELARRDALLTERFVRRWMGVEATLREIALRAGVARRPLVAAVSLTPTDRLPLGSAWRLQGMSYLSEHAVGAPPLAIDTLLTRSAKSFVDSLRSSNGVAGHDATEWTARYIETLLRCPALALGEGGIATRALLESTCNYR
ncbi:MAG: DUF2723 domain-containing protein [Gemmatimonadaceae bacterium]